MLDSNTEYIECRDSILSLLLLVRSNSPRPLRNAGFLLVFSRCYENASRVASRVASRFASRVASRVASKVASSPL